MKAQLDASHKKMAMLDVHHERIITSIGKTEATDFKANPKELESVTEHREVPNEDATVMPVSGPGKRRRVCHLAADRCQRRKKKTWGYHGSRRKLAAACRKMSRHAKVAWR
jgi:hypothetical protein